VVAVQVVALLQEALIAVLVSNLIVVSL